MRSGKGYLLGLSIAAIVMAVAGHAVLGAQDDHIVLTIGLPEWVEMQVDDEAFAGFEADHPGVDVVVIGAGDVMYPMPAEVDMAAHLEEVGKFAAAADVLMVSRYNLTPAATRAGYFLDLTPLTSTDSALDLADFYPAAWESFRWDGGTWGIPVSMTLMLLVYDPAAFDAAGLAYPDNDWTPEEFFYAAEMLTQRDASGEVTVPGFFSYSVPTVLRSLLGENLFDDSTIPAQPRLDTPQLAALLDTWRQLEDEGAIGWMGPDMVFDPNEVRLPMMVDQIYALVYGVGDGDPYAGALLPGGRAGLDVNGFGVSAGTRYPELAYELVKYLTALPDMVQGMFGDTPARRSLADVESGNYYGLDVPPDVQAVIDVALEQGLPVSDMRFVEYLDTTLARLRQGDEPDAATALRNAQEEAVLAVQTAEAQHGLATVTVATPVPTPVLASGEVALKFGMMSNVMPIPNADRWDQAVAEFVAADPQVGHIELEIGFGGPNPPADLYDCYYLPYNDVPAVAPENLLSLDPFLSADPAFDPYDFIPGALDQMRRDGQTWGLPVTLEPLVLWYNSTVWAEAGLPDPSADWTVDMFADAMIRLKSLSGDKVVLDPQMTYGNTYLLMLIAAYGGLPLDYRLGGITTNLTDPSTVEAVRQVLDLAKAGIIGYSELDVFGGGGGFGMGPNEEDRTPLYTDTLNTFSYRLMIRQNMESGQADPFRLISFPRGSQYTPVSYRLGGAYISASTPYPEACYRWLSAISRQPDLFFAMPVRLSAFGDPGLEAAMGGDHSAYYQAFANMLGDPNVVIFPDQSSSIWALSDFMIEIWVNRAFDHYVLEDADLDAELAGAQLFITAYQDCVAGAEAPDSAQAAEEQLNAYYKKLMECAVTVDPSLDEQFNP